MNTRNQYRWLTNSLAALLCLAFFPFAFAQDGMGDNKLARSLSDIPPNLEDQFSVAIRAWREFSAQDAMLRNEIKKEIKQLSEKNGSWQEESNFQTLENDDLHRYLYPWAPPSLSRLPLSKSEYSEDAILRSTESSQKLDNQLISKIKETAPTNLAPHFLKTLELWKAYRDASCLLTSFYLSDYSTSETKGNDPALPPNPQCIASFNAQLETRITQVLEEIRLGKAALTANLPSINVKGAKLHYLYVSGNSKNHETTYQTVTITDTSAPLVIILDGYEPTEWNIRIGKGVTIRQVLLFGHYRQTYKTTSTALSVRSYSVKEGNYDTVWRYLSKAQESRLDLRDALTEMIGLAPTTMQFEKPEYTWTVVDIPNRWIIDGKRTWSYVSMSKKRGKVIWTTGYRPFNKPSPEGVRVSKLGS